MKQHKHKICMCKHKQKLESTTFNGVTIIAGTPVVVGGNGNSSSSSSSSCSSNSSITNNNEEKPPSLSRQCASNWWRLKLADRKAHNELMKIQLLSPFLFCKVYQVDAWIYLAKKSGLLSEKRIDSLDDLSDEEILTADLMEQTITKLQERIIEYNNIKPNNKPIYAYLEEILDDIEAVEDTFPLIKQTLTHVETAIKVVYNKHWFKAVRKQLPAILADRHDYAVFLVAWQVCFYIKAVYHEKPLDVYKNESQLDSDLEVYKQQGNEYFKNEEYSKAIKTYTSILCEKPYLYIIYGNRAACYLKIQKYRLALSDGRRAVALSPQWDKGQYRYAQALYELGKYDETLHVLSKAIKICSSVQLISLQKDVKRSIAEGSPHIICANPFEPTTKSSANNKIPTSNGEDIDELKYANMPELETDNSDNEGQYDNSEEERIMTTHDNKSEIHKESDNKKENVKRKRKKKKTQETPAIQRPIKVGKSDLLTVMKEGSTFLLDAKTELAIREYRKVFCMMQLDPHIISSKEIAVLHYSLGWAYQESGSSLLLDSLKEFQEINRKYPDMNFPLSFYGKGLVYHKQNKFKECIVELQEALRLYNITDCVLNCCWAGVDTIIEVSIPENFKLAIDHFLSLCYHPPRPDAVCRYLQCNYRTSNIYFTDPDFKGFLRVICTENCFVEFHSSCWKKYKFEKDNHSNEKDFLTLPCFTPDCYGAIWNLQIYDNSKNKKTPKEVNVKDLNSLKKELAKKKKKDSSQSLVMDNVEDNVQHFSISKEGKQKRCRLSSTSKGEDSDESPRIKIAESATQSIAKENSLNDHPLVDPKYLRAGFEISKYYNIIDPGSVVMDIFTSFEQLLQEKGSVDLVSGTEIKNFTNKLDDNSKLLIIQVGSLRALLTACPKFSFNSNNSNIVYLSSCHDKEVYKENEQKLDEKPPDFKDPLLIKKVEDMADEKGGKIHSDKDMSSSETNAAPKVENTSKTIVPAKRTNHNESKLFNVPDIIDNIEEIDCTKSNVGIHAIKGGSKSKKHKKKVSDIIIFNDAKKEDLQCNVITSIDGPRTEHATPRKKQKGKSTNKGYKKINDHVYRLKHDRPVTPPGEKSNLRTYLEDKIEAEKNNKTPRYCCPLLGNNCSCAEIEKFCDEDGGKTRVRVMKVITIEPEGKESDSEEDTNHAVANALELIHNKQKHQSSNRRKERSFSENMTCVVEVGIQCDITNLKKVECEKEKLKTFNEDLIKRLKDSQMSNDKLSQDFEKYKEKQELVIENKNAENKSHKTSLEKLRKELLHIKNNSQDEVNKLRSEYDTKIESLTRQVMDLEQEKHDLQLVINDNAKAEVEQVSNLVRKTEEVKTLQSACEILRTQMEEMKQEFNEEKLNHEEIVNGLTNSVTEQCNRTQKVQIAFLEVKKEIVSVKYQQQAAIVQNTINQMQFWPMVPEIQNIRSVWDDFKKHFQSCYEKMQDEFKSVTQKVKDGEPLEELPPAQYAEPPPFPKTPMPNNVPIPSPYFPQTVPQALATTSSVHQHSSSSAVHPRSPVITAPQKRTTVTLSPGTNSDNTKVSPTEQPTFLGSKTSSKETMFVNNTITSCVTSVTSGVSTGVSKSNSTPPPCTSSSSLAEPNKTSIATCETKTLSFASSVKQGAGSDHQTFLSPSGNLKGSNAKHAEASGSVNEYEDSDEPRRKMFDRIIMRLGSIFPSFSREELRFYVVEYRRMQPQGSLSGMKFDELIVNLEKMIRAMKVAAKGPQKPAGDASPKKKLGKFPVVETVDCNTANKVAAKRTRANHTPTKVSSQESSSWSGAVSKPALAEIYGQGEPCVICYEDMCKGSVSKLHCGHIFHRSCISCWLKEQRTCPICRVHALLPDEYPTLG